MDKLYVLKNDEPMICRVEKLREEFHEVVEEVELYTVHNVSSDPHGYDKSKLASELLDLMQVSAGMLDELGVDIQRELIMHNKKLLGRGWTFKCKLFKLSKSKKSLFKRMIDYIMVRYYE